MSGRAVHGGPRGEPADARIRTDASSNVNAYGPAPVVTAAAAAAAVTQYPDPLSLGPRRAASNHWGRPLEELAFGAGTSELLLATMMATLRPSDTVVLATPIYGEYARTAGIIGAQTIAVSNAEPRQPPSLAALIGAIRASHPRLIVVCAPGNPLGDAWPLDALHAIAETAAESQSLLILDQSYDAFLGTPLGDPALAGHPAVLHLRSLTKDHAIPGIRAGFACGPAALIERIESVRAPWSASSVSQAAAVACFHPEAQVHVQRTVALLREAAHRLVTELRQHGVGTYQTDTHWILCDVACAATAAAVAEEQHGVRVRRLLDHGLPHTLRIAAGQPADNARIVEALGQVHRMTRLDTEKAS